jgi:hypothetical protein
MKLSFRLPAALVRFRRRRPGAPGLVVLAPVSLLLLNLALPFPWRGQDGAVSEVAGYTVRGAYGGHPLRVGVSSPSDVVVAAGASEGPLALLVPPVAQGAPWKLVPAGTGRAPFVRRSGARAAGVVLTAFQPWKPAGRNPLYWYRGEAVVADNGQARVRVERVRVAEVQLRFAPGGAPESAWLDPDQAQVVVGREAGVAALSCPARGKPRVFWKAGAEPRAGEADALCRAGSPPGWRRARACPWVRPSRDRACVRRGGPWTVRASEPGAAARVADPEGEPLDVGSLRISQQGEGRAMPRVAVQAPAGALPETWTILPEGSRAPLAEIGAPEVHAGDRMVLGGSEFLVRDRGDARAPALDLIYLRRDGAPATFRTTAGAELFHPAGAWSLPACDTAAQTVRVEHSAADGRARENRGTLLRRVPPDPGRGGVRTLTGPATADPSTTSFTLCTARAAEGAVSLRLGVDPADGIAVERNGRWNAAGSALVPLGTRVAPGEALVSAAGLLLRVAPSRALRLQAWTRWGAALYLALLVALQGWALVRSRERRRASLEAHPGWGDDLLHERRLGAASVLQAVSVCVAWLLLAGTAYQLYLSAEPRLAGVPDYGQTFLLSVVLVSAVATAACGFVFDGGPLLRRVGNAQVGAAAALALGWVWWWLDARSVPAGLWLSAARDAAAGRSGGTWMLVAAGGAAAVGLVARVGPPRWARRCLGWLLALPLVPLRVFPWKRVRERVRAPFRRLAREGVGPVDAALWGLRHPVLACFVFLALSAVVFVYRRPALSPELALLFALGWYGAARWDFARSAGGGGNADARREAVYLAAFATLAVAAVAVFLGVGAGLPDIGSTVCLGIAAGLFLGAARDARKHRQSALARLVGFWSFVVLLGAAVGGFALSDMGSVAAWLPAVFAGFFLWVVRPEEAGRRTLGVVGARTRLLLAGAGGFALLGVLDLMHAVLLALPRGMMERPLQRFALVDDVSYPIAGEWMTHVRWVASEPGAGPSWVANLNSDLAVFGVTSNFGIAWGVFISLALLGVAALVAVAADQALREGRAAEEALGRGMAAPVLRVHGDHGLRIPPALFRGLGLGMGMLASPSTFPSPVSCFPGWRTASPPTSCTRRRSSARWPSWPRSRSGAPSAWHRPDEPHADPAPRRPHPLPVSRPGRVRRSAAPPPPLLLADRGARRHRDVVDAVQVERRGRRRARAAALPPGGLRPPGSAAGARPARPHPRRGALLPGDGRRRRKDGVRGRRAAVGG